MPSKPPVAEPLPTIGHVRNAKAEMLVRREDTRGKLAAGAGIVTALTLFTILGTWLGGIVTTDQAKDVALVLLTPLLTLMGTVFGFYYGNPPGG
jgi:hypothetical protein